MNGLILLIATATALAANPTQVFAKEKAVEAIPPPEFSNPGGVYTTNFSLRITARGPAEVRFTLDGTEPAATSPICAGPLWITNSVVVKARAFASDTAGSVTASQTYTLLDPGLVDFNSNLPLVILQTFGQEIPHDSKVPVSARVIRNGNGRSTLTEAAEFDGRGLINVRGRASLRYPKRSYHLKLADDEGEAVKASLAGFPKDSDWVLYAPYPDKTLMRDVLAYELSNQLGRYASRTRYVEVFVSEAGGRLGERDYVGVYVLEEKIKRAKARVDIAKLGPENVTEPEITGGYIFKKDHSDRAEMMPANLTGYPTAQGSTSSNRPGYPTGPGGFPADPRGFLPPYQGSGSSSRDDGQPTRNRVVNSRIGAITNRIGVPVARDSSSVYRERYVAGEESSPPFPEGFKSARTNQCYYVEPGPDEIIPVQRAWLTDHINKFEDVLYGPNFASPSNGYAAFIDSDSFIDHHLLVEMTKNVDGFRFSSFFHKDRGGKIKMEPIWDWNLSFGNANGKQGWIPEYWLWPQLDDQQYSWFRRLFDDPDFGQKYVDRWGQLRTNVFAASNLVARIDQLAALLAESQARNYAKWPILGRNVYPNYYVGNSYEEEISWMKQWIEKRIAWINGQFLAPPALDFSSPARDLAMRAPQGSIHFTLDGSDPRAPGGVVAAGSRLYSSPLALAGEMKIFARARHEGRWSSPAVAFFPAAPRNSSAP